MHSSAQSAKKRLSERRNMHLAIITKRVNDINPQWKLKAERMSSPVFPIFNMMPAKTLVLKDNFDHNKRTQRNDLDIKQPWQYHFSEENVQFFQKQMAEEGSESPLYEISCLDYVKIGSALFFLFLCTIGSINYALSVE
jgi:hypothetical protein